MASAIAPSAKVLPDDGTAWKEENDEEEEVVKVSAYLQPYAAAEHVTLAERKKIFKDKKRRGSTIELNSTKGCCNTIQNNWKLFNQTFLSKGVNPLWRQEILWVASEFGAGIAGFFYQWRHLIQVDVLITVLWLLLAFLNWFSEAPEYCSGVSAAATMSNSNCTTKTSVWADDNVYWGELGGFTTADQTKQNFMFGPWFFSGYTRSMSGFNMAAWWCFGVLGSICISYAYFNSQLSSILRSGTSSVKAGQFMPVVLAKFEFSMNTEKSVKCCIKQMVIKFDTVIASNFAPPTRWTPDQKIKHQPEKEVPEDGLVMHAAQRRLDHHPEKWSVAAWKEGAAPGMHTRRWMEDQITREVNRMKPSDKKKYLEQKEAESAKAAEAAEAEAAEEAPAADTSELKSDAPPAAATAEEPAAATEVPAAAEVPAATTAAGPEESTATGSGSGVGSGSGAPGSSCGDPLGDPTERQGETAGVGGLTDSAGAAEGESDGRIFTGAVCTRSYPGGGQGSGTGAAAPEDAISVGKVPYYINMRRHDEVAGEGSVITMKVLGIFLTVCLIAGTFFCVYYTTNNSTAINKEFAMGTSLILTVCQSVIPELVKLVVAVEGWTKPEDIMFQLTLRTYFLKMMSVGILVLSLQSNPESRTGCSEADMGSQLLNLIFVDFLLNILVNPVVAVVTYYATGAKIPADEKVVSAFYIDMYYRQALIWVSVPYVPMMPLYGMCLQLIMFQVLMLTFWGFYVAAERPFEDTSGVGTVVLMMTTVVVAFFPQAAWLADEPSTSCGPMTSGEFDRRYNAMVSWVLGESPEWLQYGFTLIFNPIVVYSLLIAIFMTFTALTQKINGLNKEIHEETAQGAIALEMWREEFMANKSAQKALAHRPKSPEKARPSGADA